MKNSHESDPNVLYLDADTEITEAIEKLKKASEDEVRVVVPSRSGLLQSSVNVKLLKKAAKDAHKDLVLVTGDKITRNLAGAAGVAVASSVKAMAHVPDTDMAASKIPDKVQVIGPDEPETASQPVKASKASEGGFEPKHISLDADGDELDKKSVQQEKPKRVPNDKKVPNYGKLNKRIWWIAGGLAIVIALILAGIFIPTGKVSVQANAKKTGLNFNFILDATATSSDPAAQTLAAQKLEATKDVSFEITATGKKDVGTKATGNIAIKNCEDTNPRSLPAGSKLMASGKTFVTAEAVTIPDGAFSGGGTVCNSPSVTAVVKAAENGESYNLGATTFTIVGLPSKISGTGSTAGGSSKTITVLSAEDVANAKKQVEQQGASAQDDLSKKAGDDMMLFADTVQADIVQFNTSVQQDNEADKVAVNAKARYSGFAAKNDDVNKLFEQQIQDELKGNKQIYQNGAKDGKYSIVKQFSAQKAQLNVKTSAYYGDPIDTNQITKDVAGKPKKEVSDIVKKQGEQVTGANVETWPEFIPNMPLLPGKIKVEIKVTTD